MLGVALHRAGGDLPPSTWPRPPQGPHGGGGAEAGRPAGGRDLFHGRPVTSNRKVSSIEASFGLGEALVSGLANADSYKVRSGRIIEKAVATKELATWVVEEGGTEQRAIEPERQNRPALTDEQIVRIERLGRRIEAHFGQPQDIER
nr:PEP/pyruvate-binding domain-containing protein [Sorangium cellulosum]